MRSSALILLACAAFGVACGSEKPFEPEPIHAFNTLEVSPTGVSVRQGRSVTVAATLTRSGGNIGGGNLSVTGPPTGVGVAVTNVQSSGLVTTATVTLNVTGSTIPGTYNLLVHGTDIGVPETTAAFALTVEAMCPASGVCEQWAANATASSEYTATDWSAKQATGEPDAGGWDACEDDPHAWASLEPNGLEWLELVYDKSVSPTEIDIHEGFGVSSIVKVEVKDGAGTYYTVYTAHPGSQACPRVLTIPVTGISAMVKVVRLTFDQRTLGIWNEIDAVKLIGNSATPTEHSGIAGVYDLT